jgi:uncharacterized membrane protein YkoI
MTEGSIIMKSKAIGGALALSGILVAAGAAVVFAADRDDLAVTKASIDLRQAVEVAEQHVGGKAASAEFDQERGQAVYEIDVVKGQTVMEVMVDANSGKVLSSIEDKDS